MLLRKEACEWIYALQRMSRHRDASILPKGQAVKKKPKKTRRWWVAVYETLSVGPGRPKIELVRSVGVRTEARIKKMFPASYWTYVPIDVPVSQ